MKRKSNAVFARPFGAFCAGVLWVGLTSAAPSVTSIDGAFSESSTVKILGSGFGQRPSPSPFYWDDYESWTVGQTAVQVGLDDLGNDRKGMPYLRDDRALSGKNSVRMDYALNQNSMFPRIGKAGLNSQEVFVSVWIFWEQTAGTEDTPFIFKLVRGGTNPAYSGVPRFYETVRPDVYGVVRGGDRGSVSSSGVTTYDKTTNAGASAGAWRRTDYYFRLSTPGVADGAFQSWVNGVLNANIQNNMSRASESTALINYVMSPFDGNDSYGLNNSYALWIDDFYVDTSRARVEIGNASTLSQSNIRHILPTSEWSDTSISVEARLGSFAVGQTVYIYVFDKDGQVNSQGYPIVLSDAGVRPLAPVLVVE